MQWWYFPTLRLLSISCLGGADYRVHTWRLEGYILRKAEGLTEDRSDNSYYIILIPHLRSAGSWFFANENGDSGMPLWLKSWLKSISTADGLGDMCCVTLVDPRSR